MPRAQGLDPAEIYEYLVAAREGVLAAVRGLTFAQYTREFPFGKRTLRHTLVEIPLAESNYVRRLRGEPVPPLAEHPFARFYETDFPPLEAAWREQAEVTRQVLRSIEDWTRPVEYVVRQPDRPARRVRTTAGGVATQLLLHEVHHRAQAMAMLRQLGAPVETIDFSALTFASEPLPEGSSR